MPTSISLYKTVKGVTPIRLGRRIFISGLYWEVLPNGQNYRDEARKIARRERERTGVTLDVAFLRRHVDVVQAGFVVRGGRARKGTVALAAVAADALGPTFIAAFPLPDGRYALASAVHDAIVPDSDGVHDHDEAKRRLQDLWNTLSGSVGGDELAVYAPAELWPDARPASLEDLLAHVKRSHRLRPQPALTGRNALVWLGWAVLAGALASGWLAWEAYQAQRAREAAALQAQTHHAQRDQRAGPAELARMRPWTGQASVQDFARHCTASIGGLPVTLDGWVLLNAQCSAKTLSASYARTEGRTVTGFHGAVQRWRPNTTAHFSTDGDLGTVQYALSMGAKGDEGLQPIEHRANAFMTYWQTRLMPFDLKSIGSVMAPGYSPDPDATDPRLLKPHWKTMRWTIPATARNPMHLVSELNTDGLRLQEITMAFSADGKLNWTLKGELYGE